MHRCRIVAGSANNQLADADAAELLRTGGILYAPDYVINAGGAIALVGREQLGWDTRELDAALEGIGTTLRQIYQRAEELGVSTAAAADALADERLQAAQPPHPPAFVVAVAGSRLPLDRRTTTTTGGAASVTAGAGSGRWR